MKLFARVGVFAFAVTIALPMSANAQVKPIRTKRPEFRIPFAFSQADYARIGAQEVQLFLSVDHGDTWQHVQSALPTAQKFRFRAGNDGEHWFAVRTLDRSGRLRPLGQLSPGLIVLVDTSQPRLNLDLVERPGEGVTVHWRMLDADLNLDSVRMEYRLNESGPWEPLQPERTAHGQLDIPLPTAVTAASSAVTVRMGVEDGAGNSAKTERTATVRGQRPLQPEPETEPLPQPNASTFGLDVLSSRELSAVRPAEKTPARSVSMRSEQAIPSAVAVKPEDATIMQIKPARAITVNPRPVVHPAGVESPTIVSDSPEQHTPEEALVPAAGHVAAVTMQASQSSQTTPAVSASASADHGEDQELAIEQYAPATPEPVAEPPRAAIGQPQVIRHREFLLGYSIDDLGSSGVGSVEVFITENNGEKWWRYGEDTDRKSPFEVRVPRDGRYGFHVAARSGAGLGGTPPSPGDPPQVVIVVDQAAPQGSITDIGMSDDGRTLIVKWDVEDPNCGDAPVRLEYSPRLTGPWQPIQDWQQNTGELKWVVGRGLPPRIHVRILMKDAAGNQATFVYPSTVLVDTSKPRVRIIDVQVPGERGTGR